MRTTIPIFALVALLLAGGASRLVQLEVERGAELRAAADRQHRAVRAIPARRGEVLDTRGRVLAGTVRRPSVYIDAQLLRGPEDARFTAYSLAPALHLDPAAVEQQLSAWLAAGTRFEWLKRRITDEELATVAQVIETRRLSAVEVEFEPVRVYPHGPVAPHVLGFVGVDAQGLAGIEQEYDAILAGTPGRWVATVDARRRRVRSRHDEYVPAQNGATIVLTLDAYLQQMTQDRLRKAYEKHACEWCTAVVIDPQTGEVLAMAVCPDFDPADPIPPGYNKLGETQRLEAARVWQNRAVTDSYEPGSIFKPFIASLAYDEGLVRMEEVFAINGPVRDFGRRSIRDTHAYGALTLHEVISKSSNIGMGMIGARCGMDRLHRFVRTFGFGDITGIGLPGEHTGMVQDRANWNPSYSPQSIPIGQEIAVTPIQVVTAFSVFCNGGVLLRPRIVRGIIGPEGETLADYSRPVPVRRVLDARTADEFRMQALVETVRAGTGKQAALEDYQLFGKTGTAQIARKGGGGYLPGQYVGSFVAGAPTADPRLVVLVSIYHPTREGYYGGTIAAPVVKEIMAEALAYMQIPPEIVAPVEAAGSKRRTDGARNSRDGQEHDAGAD